MVKKKFIDLKEDDTVYWISMVDSEIQEAFGTSLKTLKVSGLVRSTNMYTISVRTKGGTFFTVEPNKSAHVLRINQKDEVDLSFEVYATTKEEAVEKAREEILGRLRELVIIKKRVNESETGLLLAEATLDNVDTSEETSLEEFASMALG